MRKNLCIIQARTRSTRLADKVMLRVEGRPMLEYQIKRLKLSKHINKIVIATTKDKSDDQIENLCKKLGVACFRGSEEDVLDRYYQCSLKYKNFENIIRLTGDCPLIDPKVVDEVIVFFNQNKTLDFAGNVLKRTFPHGLDVEIFKRQALRETAQKATLPTDREHVDEYMLNHERFKKGNLTSPYDFSHFRLTLDYEEDFAVIKFLIEHSRLEDGYLKYISLLSRNPEVMFKNINYNIENDFIKSWNLLKKKSGFAENKAKVLVVLGGALVKDKAGWRTTNYNEGDNFGISGDRLRIVAADLVVRHMADNNYIIIASGGKGQLRHVPGSPNVSSVVKKELVLIGIPADKIIEENNSNNTYEQLMELKKLIKEKKFQHVTILSNKHHFPRLKAFIEHDAELKQMSFQSSIGLKLAAAEDILLKYGPEKWKRIIARAYASKAMKERMALERKGVREIKNGSYKFNRNY